jgi:serine protease AprX
MSGVRQERGSALWGQRGRRKRLAASAAAFLVAFGFAGVAAHSASATPPWKSTVPKDVLAQWQANPNQIFNVIVQGTKGVSSDSVGNDVGAAQKGKPGVARGVFKRFKLINGAAASLTGDQLLQLIKNPHIGVVTPDVRTVSTGSSNVQLWPDVSQLSAFWAHNDASTGSSLQAPTIALVDSGIDASNSAFGGRVVATADLYSGDGQNSAGDGLGHGTMVAGIAAGADDGHAGGVPNANLVALDVLDDQGAGSTSDLISACDWIIANKDTYGIKVVNISVVGSQNSSFLYDPLDKAVEKLWLNGVVVVAAAGNYGVADSASNVPYAPANDPFVLTVGAADTNGTTDTADDFAAPWSAWGYTNDGFAKPEVSAPGRYMDGPVPAAGAMNGMFPDRVVEPGYLWMSGTSFAAPVVSAAAAYVLALHPSWTPDQVKGALMVTSADPAGYSGVGLGVGEVQADNAATLADGTANPNLGLDQFVSADPTTGLNTFDGDSWQTAATNDPTWNSMSWASQSWASQSWASQSWASQSWASQSWASQSWASQSWASMSWASQSWASQSWAAMSSLK